jgi:hypothetical protein
MTLAPISKKRVANYSREVDTAQGSDLMPVFGDWSLSENISEIKSFLVCLLYNLTKLGLICIFSD